MEAEFRYIEIGRDLRTKVSPHRFEFLSQFKWHPQILSGGDLIYAKCNYWKEKDGKRYRSTMFMHRLITGCPPELQVDHDDNDGLNNTDGNLVVCGSRYNLSNRRTAGPSGYRGVSQCQGKWQAILTDLTVWPSAKIYLGRFADPVEGARAYDRAALTKYGPFFPINFPLTDYPDLIGDREFKKPDPVSEIPF